MKCFKDHEVDQWDLSLPMRPISECESKMEYVDGVWTKITTIHMLPCEYVWYAYQKEAEEIVAPGGQLIADPRERNRAISAAYARLWLYDKRFQWAGLAAFASKQVGCGLLHASNMVDVMEAEEDAALAFLKQHAIGFGRWFGNEQEYQSARESYREARMRNPLPTFDVSGNGFFPRYILSDAGMPGLHLQQSLLSMGVREQFNYVHEMLALGNTALFLDIYPLHAFYAKRGLAHLERCLKERTLIAENRLKPIYWPVARNRLRFGRAQDQIVRAFEAMEQGNIAESVEWLAEHEQINILQPAMYENWYFSLLLRGNHMSFVTGFPKNLAQPVELTLASQCRPLEAEYTVSFDNSIRANLANVEQRMSFVLRAAGQFDELLKGPQRHIIEQAIIDIAGGEGVR